MQDEDNSSVSRWRQPVDQETIRQEEQRRRKRATMVYILIAIVVLLFVGAVSYSLGGQSRRRAGQDQAAPPSSDINPAMTAQEATPVDVKPVPTDPETIKALLSNPDNPVVKISTSKGDMLAELYEDKVPNTVANMITLAEDGFYKGMTFHRIIPDFMAQGGCPNSKKDARGMPGTGDPGYKFADEFHDDLSHSERGILSMANSGPNTNGSQFFICFGPTPHLDGKHSVFGNVVAGEDVLDRLEKIGTRSGDPKEEVRFDIQVIKKQDHPYTVEKL